VCSFSKSDKSRSIRAKRSAFSMKIWSAPTHLRKSGLATPICAAWRRRCLFSVYHRHHEYSWCLWCLLVEEGVVCGALCTVRIRDTTPTTTRKICVFFFTGLDQSRLRFVNLDLSDFEKECNQWHLPGRLHTGTSGPRPGSLLPRRTLECPHK